MLKVQMTFLFLLWLSVETTIGQTLVSEKCDNKGSQQELDALKRQVHTLMQTPGKSVLPAVSFFATYNRRRYILALNETAIFTRVLSNVGGGYDVTTGNFVAPYRGIYSISATIMSENDSDIHIGMMKNEELLMTLYSNSNTYPQSSATVHLPLDINDRVYLISTLRPNKKLHVFPFSPNFYNTFSGALVVLL